MFAGEASGNGFVVNAMLAPLIDFAKCRQGSVQVGDRIKLRNRCKHIVLQVVVRALNAALLVTFPGRLQDWGIFASLLLATGSFAFIVFPELENTIEPAYFVPMLIFQLVTGFWLMIRGLRLQQTSSA